MYRNGDQPSVKHLIGYIPGIICTYLGDIHADWVYLVYWCVQSMGYILLATKVSPEKKDNPDTQNCRFMVSENPDFAHRYFETD